MQPRKEHWSGLLQDRRGLLPQRFVSGATKAQAMQDCRDAIVEMIMAGSFDVQAFSPDCPPADVGVADLSDHDTEPDDADRPASPAP